MADEIDAADVDTELERSGGDQGSNFAGFEFLFRCEAELAGKAAVVGGYGVATQALGQVMRYAFA